MHLSKAGEGVCITGMHRSGTSMVARLLNLCGLYLGPEDQIIPAGAGNPTGFWENRPMDDLNEAILAQLSDGWDFLLPEMPADWAKSPELDHLRALAHHHLGIIARQSPWGWKDPRATITVPFWQTVLPDLRFIICLRDPAEVAHSLQKHAGGSIEFNYHLWLEYNERILAATDTGNRLIVHYDLFFIDPTAELHRIIAWLGWEVEEAKIQGAIASIDTSIRQQKMGSSDGPSSEIPHEAANLYMALLGMGGDGLKTAVDDGKIAMPYVIGTPNLIATGTDDPDAAAPHIEAAEAAVAKEDYATAIIEMKKALQQSPTMVAVCRDIGILYLRENNFARAIPYFERAFVLSPDDTDTITLLVEAYLNVGRNEDAIHLHLKIVEKQPENIKALLWLAAAAVPLNLFEKSLGYLNRVLEIDPANEAARAVKAAVMASEAYQTRAN